MITSLKFRFRDDLLACIMEIARFLAISMLAEMTRCHLRRNRYRVSGVVVGLQHTCVGLSIRCGRSDIDPRIKSRLTSDVHKGLTLTNYVDMIRRIWYFMFHVRFENGLHA